MAGHSKWSNIKHRKSAQDSKKSKIASKLVKEIKVAVQEGGIVAENNAKLRIALKKAKIANLSKKIIEKILQKNQNKENYLHRYLYSVYAPEGVVLLVNIISDNIKRSLPALRYFLHKRGLNLGEQGENKHLFSPKVYIYLSPIPKKEIEKILMIFAKEEAEDFEEKEDGIKIWGAYNLFGKWQKLVEKQGWSFKEYTMVYRPLHFIEIEEEKRKKVLNLVLQLEILDDVHAVYHSVK